MLHVGLRLTTRPSIRPRLRGVAGAALISILTLTSCQVQVPIAIHTDVPCAGTALLGLRIAMGSDNIARGVIVDPQRPDVPLQPGEFDLSWPPGYSATVGSAGLEIHGPGDNVVISNGALLTGPQVCAGEGHLWILDVGTVTGPGTS